MFFCDAILTIAAIKQHYIGGRQNYRWIYTLM